jgi:hypothetical protein
MSDWSVHSPIEYLVMFFYSDYSLFRLFLYSDYSWNTGIIGILIIAALRHLSCLADPPTQQLNIRSILSYSDYSWIPVFGCMSGWSVHSAIEYPVILQLFQLFLHVSIGLHVWLICTLSHWILSQPSVLPIIHAFQYWIAYQADL